MKRKLFVVSLWYFPSHFGLHVDDVSRAFSDKGYEVTIVTVARRTFDLPYFDSFRDTFDATAIDGRNVIRLNVAYLEERGAYNPHVFLQRDAIFLNCKRRMEAGPCTLLHFFEMLLPTFNAETIGSARACSLLYAGNFLRRIAAQEAPKAPMHRVKERIIRKLLDRSRVGLPNGSYELRGTDRIFSETRELPRMLRTSRLCTPASWTSRPIFPDPILAAPTCDVGAEFDIPKGAKVLLYAGRPAKNARILPAILELVQRRRERDLVFLLLVGSPPEDVVDWPRVAAWRKQIRTCPLVDRDRLFGIMKAVDVLAYPGLVDGYPKVISEAGLAGLPVVAFDSPASGLHEMGRNGDVALMIDAASPTGTSAAENAAFAAAIDRILSGPALRKALVGRAFHAASLMDAHHFVARIERHWHEHSTAARSSASL